MLISSESQIDIIPSGLKAMFQAGRSNFLLVRLVFSFRKGSSHQVLVAASHYVELSHVGMLATRQPRKLSISTFHKRKKKGLYLTFGR